MIKRALAATLCLMLVFALLPKTARADSTDTLYFSGGQLYTDSTYSTPYPPDSTWSGSGSTLTLTNFNFTTSAATALYLKANTTLVLNGTNSVTSNYSGIDHTHGIYCGNTLEIQGTGTLTATGGTPTGKIVAVDPARTHESCGVYSMNGIIVSGGSITGTGGKLCTDARGGYTCGVYLSNGNISVYNGGTIKGTGGEVPDDEIGDMRHGFSYGVLIETGTIDASNGGSITGTGGNTGTSSSYGVGILSKGTITAESGGSITGTGGTAKGECSYGVIAGTTNSTISVNGGSITGINSHSALAYQINSFGIVAETVNVISGRLVAESVDGGNAIYNNSGLNILPSDYYWRKSKSAAYTAASAVLPIDFSYVDIRTELPTLGITVSVPAFDAGQAPVNEAVTIEPHDGINATDNFGSATMDGQPIDLGTVGAPGKEGSVENGSILIRLNKAYLDTLTVGTHTLRVNLAGVYAGKFVEAQITVLPLGDGFGDAGDVPKTGDAATPVLWLGLMLLAGAGLIVSAVRRRKRQNG